MLSLLFVYAAQVLRDVLLCGFLIPLLNCIQSGEELRQGCVTWVTAWNGNGTRQRPIRGFFRLAQDDSVGGVMRIAGARRRVADRSRFRGSEVQAMGSAFPGTYPAYERSIAGRNFP